jgi:hypothetical protein
MKSTILILAMLLVLTTAASATYGSVWVTRDDCGPRSQSITTYARGETVWVNGESYDPGDHAWTVTGEPGITCDDGIDVASGTVTVGEDGTFCFAAYTVQNDDCGEYKVPVGNMYTKYVVDENQVPEFGLIAGGVALAGAVAGFFLLRKK